VVIMLQQTSIGPRGDLNKYYYGHNKNKEPQVVKNPKLKLIG